MQRVVHWCSSFSQVRIHLPIWSHWSWMFQPFICYFAYLCQLTRSHIKLPSPLFTPCALQPLKLSNYSWCVIGHCNNKHTKYLIVCLSFSYHKFANILKSFNLLNRFISNSFSVNCTHPTAKAASGLHTPLVRNHWSRVKEKSVM